MPTFFLTGSSTGFGRRLAERILADGHRLFATARQPSGLDDLVARYPENCHTCALDITDASAVSASVARALEIFGEVDVLINNAGAGLVGALEETTDEQMRRNFEVNFFGHINVIRALLPHFRSRRSGRIVNNSAIAGFCNEAGFPIYGAAKFALEGLSESLRGELAPLGIHVTLIEPGPFRTDFIARSLEQAENRIADYDATAGKFRDLLQRISGQQTGDPEKGAAAILAAALAEKPPLRLVLGKYAYAKAEKKLVAVKAELDTWRETGINTDFSTRPVIAVTAK